MGACFCSSKMHLDANSWEILPNNGHYCRETYKSREQQCDQVAQQKPQEDGFSWRVFHLHFWVLSTSQERTICCYRQQPWNTTDIKEHKQQLECSHENVLCLFFLEMSQFKVRESAFATSSVWDELQHSDFVSRKAGPGKISVFGIFFGCFFPQNCDTLGVFSRVLSRRIMWLPYYIYLHLPIKTSPIHYR